MFSALDTEATGYKCHLPLFVNDAGDEKFAFRTVFLGNMFLDKYFVINDMSQAGSPYSSHHPMVGIYEKKAPPPLVEETAFLQ